ncbi:acetyl-CoA synthetase-like protein [Aaosphaeria arxii CBS 175.79]|uniref:Very long-chain fatty acid transport protein n=1 Tax=Aaosphaeria arxii CBS 175.79 TaxID=1450172 RepID=A0A6A5X771_9PLEO|nr:acetyl-CoA synthetase-like protein [Aaosphaeria arxii CBS 175.79]KAF2008770.1 acetyl-CoA synthetase-like protein [Aaosphaeria arxii CBS 175.79]
MTEKRNLISPWYSFVGHVPKHPNEECIWSREKSYTWQETHDRAIQWAQFFLSKGVTPGDMVGTYLMNSADFLVIWLGLFCIGCAPAMLNYNLKGDALIHCLKIAGVKLVLVDVDPECRERFEASRDRVENELNVTPYLVDDELLSSIYAGKVELPGDEFRARVTGPSPSCLLYTSGTTGLPKAGMYTIARFHERGNPENLSFDQKAGPDGDRWYCCMPLFHGTGGLSTMGALTSGLSAAVGRKFSVSTFWNDIHDSRSTIFVYVGEAARYLLMAPPHPLERDHPRLRGMFGNGMRPDVWAKFKDRFDVPEVIEFFNSTEGVLALVIHSKGPFTESCVGQHGLVLRRLLHDTLVPVAIDAETGDLLRDPETGFVKRNSYTDGGEILVNVPSEAAFAGYHNNPTATAKKFERNVFKKGDLYYRSGDALRRDDDGRWFFLDRLGDTYRWKSENVSTAEVAEVLGRYPGISEAMVYGVLVPRHDGRAGCVALRFDSAVASADTFDWTAFLAYARSKLPRYAVPLFVRLVSESSRTDNQKQNKSPLKDEGIELERYGEKVADGKTDVVLWVRPGGETHIYTRT